MTILSIGQIYKTNRPSNLGITFEIEIVSVEPGLVKFIANSTDLDKEYYLFGMSDYYRDAMVYSSRYRSLVNAIDQGFWTLDTAATLANINLYVNLGFLKNDTKETETV